MKISYVMVLGMLAVTVLMEIIKSFGNIKDGFCRLIAFALSIGVCMLSCWVFNIPETYKAAFLYAPGLYFLQEIFDVDFLKGFVKKLVIKKLKDDGLDIEGDDDADN